MSLLKSELKPEWINVKGILLPRFFPADKVEAALQVIPNDGDIILATYPKCGTNWTAQILVTLLKKGSPPGNGAEFTKLCPYLEVSGPESIINLPLPRCYKTHFDFHQVPKSPKAKYICIIRNPKDCLISLYHFMQSDKFGFKGGDFNVLFNLFLKGEVMYNDYFDHILSWYERRNDDNVLFLYYEKMKSDPRSAILKIGKIMGPDYEKVLETKLDDVERYSSFQYMKENTNVHMKDFLKEKFSKDVVHNVSEGAVDKGEDVEIKNSSEFIRKGIVGDWKNVLTDEQSELLNDLIEKRIKDTEMYKYWKEIGCI